MTYTLTFEQDTWLAHARAHGFYYIADHVERQWKRGRMGQVDGRTPMPGLERTLNRINNAIAKGTYYRKTQ